MMGRVGILLTVTAAVLPLLILTGCAVQTRPSSFYDLSPDPNLSGAAVALPVAVTTVGVGPVRMPDALDRPQIVTRSSRYRLGISEFDRWGGSLRDTFPRTLAENLSEMLSPVPVAVLPWSGMPRPSHRVVMDVRRFDGEWGGRLVLVVNWAILNSRAGDPLLTRRSRIEEKIASDTFSDYVAAQSRAVAALSREIAAALAALP